MSLFGTSKPSIFEATASLTVSGTTYAGGYITITTTTAHGLTAGETVYISGVLTMTDANGLWTVYDCPLTTTFRIVKETAQASGSSGSVRKGFQFKNSSLDYVFIEPDQLNYRSVINGNKTNTHLGDYGSFKITERLWQKSAVFTTKLKFQRLYGLYHTDVWLFPHSDKYVQDSLTNVVTCYFKTLKPIRYKEYINYDAAICEFETNKYHDVTKLLV